MSYIKCLCFVFICMVGMSCNSQNNTGMIDYKDKIREIASDKNAVKDNLLFFVEYGYTKCRIEIFVNDKLLVKSYKYFKDSQGNKFINHFLLKSKKQKVKIKIFPSKGDIFDEHSSFRVELSSLTKDLWLSDSFDSQNYFIKYNTSDIKKTSDGSPLLDDDNRFVKKENIEGLSYFEKEFEFEAEMPFENEALQNSKDLREIDSTILEQKVLAQYHAFINSVKNKDEDTYWEMYYNKVAYFSKANFLTKTSINDVIEEGKMIYNNIKFLPIENYEMVFYDEGRLVCFESKSNDLEFKGKSPLVGTTKQYDNSIYKKPIQFYFYMPKDSNELKIMY